jgi:hypothetical protein
MVAVIAASAIPSNLAFGLMIRWMQLVMPYANVGPNLPPLVAVVLTPIQWVVVGLWVNHRIRDVGPWGALAWTTFSVIAVGYGTGLLLGIFGYTHVFEGP